MYHLNQYMYNCNYKISCNTNKPKKCADKTYYQACKSNCDNKYDYKKEIDTYLHRKQIIIQIEKCMTDIGIENLYDKTIIDSVFNVQKMKEVLRMHGEINIDTWIEYGKELTGELDNQMMQYYEQIMLTLKGKHIEEVIDDIISRIKDSKYCFQGGTGHTVRAYHLKLPHHWVVRPEFYNIVKFDPIEKLALFIKKEQITIDEVASLQIWGN